MELVPGVQGWRTEFALGRLAHEPFEDRVQLLVTNLSPCSRLLPDVEDPERAVSVVEAGGVHDQAVRGAVEGESRDDRVVVVGAEVPSTIGNSWMYATAMDASLGWCFIVSTPGRPAGRTATAVPLATR